MYSFLSKYLPYFEEKLGTSYEWTKSELYEDGSINLSYPIYDDMLSSFIIECDQQQLLEDDYNRILDEKVGFKRKDDTIKNNITKYDEETLRALLTFYIRSERFCDGAWNQAVQNGMFLVIIQQLLDLT